MKKYIPLALGFALGEARALGPAQRVDIMQSATETVENTVPDNSHAEDTRIDKQKKCIDKIVLDVQIKRDVGLFGKMYLSASPEEQLSFREQVLRSVAELYTKELGIPIIVKYFGEYNPKHTQEDAFSVMYGSIQDAIDYVVYEKMEQVPLPLLLGIAVEMAELGGSRIFLFPTYEGDMDDIPRFHSFTLNHGIGHAFGLEDTTDSHLPDGRQNIMGSISVKNLNANTKETLTLPYSFSEADKAKIQSQMCKPEETK